MEETVITGASGFIGHAVCALLAGAGHRVIAVSRNPGYRFPDPRIETLELDALPRMSSAACIHLAGSGLASDVAGDPDAHARLAEQSARKLLNHGFKKVIFVSSGAVYGDQNTAPATEETPPAPCSAYGRLKLMQESLFMSGVNVVARLSNVYGPGMSPENVISHALNRLENGGHLVMRELVSVRDYIFVSDVARALIALAGSNLRGTYNVSTGKGTRVDELVRLLANIEGKQAACIAEHDAPPSTLILNPHKIEAALGWKAEVSLQQGLERMVRQCR